MGTLLENYKEVRISVPWGHISGRWYGNRTERPILAIHGWLDNLGTFDRLIPLLPDYLGVLCIDLPGHGRSSHLPPGMRYSVMDFMLVIPLIMREYGWTKVSLILHSLAAFLGHLYTCLAPDTVDMIICLDLLLLKMDSPREAIEWISRSLESHDWQDKMRNKGEPTLRTREEFLNLVSKDTRNSVHPSLAHHLTHRTGIRSKTFPDKLFSSRDDRVKCLHQLHIMDSGLAAELARRIQPMPYMIIKATDSKFLGSHCDEVISLLASNNPHFEFHVIEGTHHVHLHSAEECAKYIVPFIRRHRPPPGNEPLGDRSHL